MPDDTNSSRVSASTSVEPPPIDLRAYLAVVRKRMWSIVAVFVVVVAAAGLWVARQPRIYKASTSIVIDPMPPRALKNVSDVVEIGAGNYWATKEFYETEYKIIRSRDVCQKVVDKLGLAKDPAFLGVAGGADPDLRAKLVADADPVAILRSMVTVEPVKDSRMVLVSVSDTDPKRAALLSTAVAEAYRDQNVERRIEGTGNVVEWLDEQIKGLKPRLEASEMALYDYRKKNDMLTASLEDRQNIVSQKLLDLNKSLTQLHSQRIQLEAKIAQIHKLQPLAKKDPSAFDSLPEVENSDLIQNLKESLAVREQEYAQLQQRYGPKHPKLVAAGEALGAARSAVDHEIANVVSGIEGKYQEVVDAERGTQRLLDDVKAEAFDLNKKAIGYGRLEREKKDNERLYNMVLERMKEANISGQQRTNNVRIVDAALVPVRPVKPRAFVDLSVASVLGLFLAFGIAFVREYLDTSLKTKEQVEDELGIPFLGIIPLVQERAATTGQAVDLHVLGNPRGQVAEACRSIRTNLLFMSPEHPLRRLLVTSAGPREGKTTTVVDLGIVMAQSGGSVVLVDTDMRRPRLHKVFGVSGEVGLSSVILGEATLADAVKTTEVPGLSVLPCGPIPPNPAELLHTERFARILDELAERFERTLLDSPPLGAVADAKVLSVRADGALIVVRSHKTSKDMVAQAADSILDVKGRILGVVLNQVDLERREYGGYYYQYYRQYGAYYGADAASSAKDQG